MGVVPFCLSGPNKSVVQRQDDFDLDGNAVLILDLDASQFDDNKSNATYDLRVGDKYKDHRNDATQSLRDGDYIELLPGNAVIIQTEEEIHFPTRLFGHILPRVKLLEKGIANTPSKIDPGYHGYLLITAFNHGKRTEKLTRKERFCSLHLLSVEEGIIPFNGPTKQLPGMVRTKGFQRARDWLETRQIWLTLIMAAFAVISAVLSVVAILVAAHNGTARLP
jgi:dUTPase